MKIFFSKQNGSYSGDVINSVFADIIEQNYGKEGVAEVEKVLNYAARMFDPKAEVHFSDYSLKDSAGRAFNGKIMFSSIKRKKSYSASLLKEQLKNVLEANKIGDYYKSLAFDCLNELCSAELKAHEKIEGRSHSEAHLHECSDILVYISGVAKSMEILKITSEDIFTSYPLLTGFGTVECSHGTLNIPAPATRTILDRIVEDFKIKDTLFKEGNIEFERITPTGAAILKTITGKFDSFSPNYYEGKARGIRFKNCNNNIRVLRVNYVKSF